MKKIFVSCLLLLMIMFLFIPYSYATHDNVQEAPSSPVASLTPTDFFTAENVLSIILITVGVVLILLAIAIFIRLKKG
ncbi:MAG: hypothetical protein FWC68_06255 [Oscillospiraceae bacterium]|nr:hypothetical protein [Oscillospiraceae bacterium]